DALDIPRAHVLGVSMGGMIAQELAIRHPERVRGLVLACTFPEAEPDVLARAERGLATFVGGVGADGTAQLDASGIDPFAFFQMLLPKVFNVSFIETELPRLMELFGGALQYGFDMDAVMAQVEATMAHRTTDRLHAIKSPTLVITGDNRHTVR